MIREWTIAILAGLASLTPATAQIGGQIDSQAATGGEPALQSGVPTLSVLTYNVKGLPFPFAYARGSAAQRIAARLAGLRAAGRQPHVVVLQEAFGAAQKAIGQAAGYRYTALGPGKHARSDEVMTAADRAFMAEGHYRKGEDLGKWRSSGLAILSDYPIVTVHRAVFPAWACAGYDCLANKGVMLAEIAVPGLDRPVAVVATHMNSKGASGVGPARWNAAFDRQAQTIGSFLARNLDPAMPYIFAGDTNIGTSPERRAWFDRALTGLPRTAANQGVRTALATCMVANSACTVEAPVQAEKSYRRGKDLQVYADGATIKVQPLAIAVPFGEDARGRMLSDHIGYTAVYRLSQLARPAS